MTPKQRREYASEFDRALNAIEKRFVVIIYNQMVKQFAGVARKVKAGELNSAVSAMSGISMLQPIMKMQQVAGLLMGRRTLTKLNTFKQKRTMGFNQEWTDEIIRFFRQHNLALVSKIDETSRQHILRILEQGTIEGLSVDEMAKLINDQLYLAHRAQRIVRTESTRAANQGVSLGARSYEYQVVQEWCSVHDNRTRHTHVQIDGQIREVGEPFGNGLMFPGDPNGPAKEVVNCRCAMAIVPKRDEQGRLIPKRSISVIMPGNFVRDRQIVTI